MLLPFLSHSLFHFNAGTDPEIENFIFGISIDLFSYLRVLDVRYGGAFDHILTLDGLSKPR